MQVLQVRQALTQPIRHMNSRRAAVAVLAAGQLPRERRPRTAGAKNHRFGAVTPVLDGNECLQGITGGPGIDGSAMEFPVALEDAADLGKRSCQRIEDIELIRARGMEIDLVRGDERTKGKRIVFDEPDRGTIMRGSVMQRKIDSTKFAVSEPQAARPKRENSVDRGLRRGHTDEVHRGPRRGSEVVDHASCMHGPSWNYNRRFPAAEKCRRRHAK
jgi:hypothetical protein